VIVALSGIPTIGSTRQVRVLTGEPNAPIRLGHRWKNHFMRKAAETGAPIEVRQLRQWIDEPKPMGLPTEARNLVIMVREPWAGPSGRDA
jgi:hypothetical protein